MSKNLERHGVWADEASLYDIAMGVGGTRRLMQNAEDAMAELLPLLEAGEQRERAIQIQATLSKARSNAETLEELMQILTGRALACFMPQDMIKAILTAVVGGSVDHLWEDKDE